MTKVNGYRVESIGDNRAIIYMGSGRTVNTTVDRVQSAIERYGDKTESASGRKRLNRHFRLKVEGE